MAGAEAASRVGFLLENTSMVCIPSCPCFTNLLNNSTIIFRDICGRKSQTKICPHTVGPTQIKRVNGFYSKLDGDKGTHNKVHRKASGGTRDVRAQMSRCVQALCRKEGALREVGNESYGHLGTAV